jgi:Domain of unknown function (DUF4382)
MRFRKVLPVAVFVCTSFLTSCSGKHGGPCTINCGNGNATVGVTLAATPLTPPPGTNLLSFTVDVVGVSLTPSSGSTVSIPLNATTYVVDLTKVQSDSVFLGISAGVPAGTYSSMTVSLSNPSVTYCTQTSGNSGCANGSLAIVTGPAAAPQISTAPFPLTLTADQQTGLAVNVNLSNILTISQTQAVTAVKLAAANALSASALPPAASNLVTGELDFIDDVTGNVTAVSGQSVTVKTATRGSLTAVANSSTVFSPNCTNLFNRATSIACAKVGDVASLDMTLNPDGTFTLLEYDPLDSATGDWLEGVVTAPATSSVQFKIVTNDLVAATANSLLGTNPITGTPVTVTLTGTNPFLIDSKGFNVTGASIGTDASSLLPGQTVFLHVTSFTAASGTPPVALATIDKLYLRFTRVSGSVVGTGTLTSFNIQSLPTLFGISTQQQVGLTQGAPPSVPATNFDGASVGTGLSNQTVSIQALYFRPNTFTYTFVAAKVRAH